MAQKEKENYKQIGKELKDGGMGMCSFTLTRTFTKSPHFMFLIPTYVVPCLQRAYNLTSCDHKEQPLATCTCIKCFKRGY